jgi:hypothetical protein
MGTITADGCIHAHLKRFLWMHVKAQDIGLHHVIGLGIRLIGLL